MTEDIYFKLDERLNENPIKWPLEDTFLWCRSWALMKRAWRRAMEALSVVDEMIRVNQAHCIGCGNCASVCPVGALSMARRASVVPPQGGMTMGGLAV